MPFKGLTMDTRPDTPAHIGAEDDAILYQSMLGMDGVFEIGSKFKQQILSNNKIRISDGVISVQGHIGRIVYGDYVDLTIENGMSGQNRHDLIVAKFVSGGTEDTYTIEVKKGTPGAVAKDPTVQQEKLYEGGDTYELPLYRVVLTGLSIMKVEPMFETIHSSEYMGRTSNYSLEEQRVGTWVDGKPLFQKTLMKTFQESGMSPSGTDGKKADWETGWGKGYIDKIVKMDVMNWCEPGMVGQYCDPSNDGNWGVGGDFFRVFYNGNNGNLNVTCGKANPPRPFTAVVTLLYTKK